MNAPDVETLKELVELDADDVTVVWPTGLNAKKAAALIKEFKELEATAARETDANLVRDLEAAMEANEEADGLELDLRYYEDSFEDNRTAIYHDIYDEGGNNAPRLHRANY